MNVLTKNRNQVSVVKLYISVCSSKLRSLGWCRKAFIPLGLVSLYFVSLFCLLFCLFYVICAPVPGERCLNSLNLRYMRRLQLSVKHIHSRPCLRRFLYYFQLNESFKLWLAIYSNNTSQTMTFLPLYCHSLSSNMIKYFYISLKAAW